VVVALAGYWYVRSVERSLRTPDVAPELPAVKENELTHSSPRPIVTVMVAGNSPRINLLHRQWGLHFQLAQQFLHVPGQYVALQVDPCAGPLRRAGIRAKVGRVALR